MEERRNIKREVKIGVGLDNLPLKQWNEILNFEFSFQPASLAQFSLGKILKNSLAPTP